MRIANALAANRKDNRRSWSLEYFPPKTSGAFEQLWHTVDQLARFDLDFVSVTYGAGGSTQALSQSVTEQMMHRTGLPVLAHLTCVGATAREIDAVISGFAEVGVTDFLALRGDPVAGPGTTWQSTPNGYDYAVQLVTALAKQKQFGIGVAAFPAGHPESASLDQDAKVLAGKQAAGAHFAITNLFFDANRYFDLVDRAKAAGCDFPILPGLMPVTNVKQIERFAKLSGAEFPADLAEKFHRIAADESAVLELGIQSTLELAAKLLAGGAPGIHLYSLNQPAAAVRILDSLQGQSS